MAQPTRQSGSDIEPDIEPDFRSDALGQSDARRAEQAAELANQEKSTGAGQSNGDVKSAEESPKEPEWKDATGQKLKGTAKKAGKSSLKGKGPLLAIGGGVGLGGLGLLILLIPALLLFHLLANLFDTYDTSGVALTQVMKRVLIVKLGSTDATSGRCSTVQIACRFKTPSNELLRQLKANGITALDSRGNPINIDSNKKWPTEKPSRYLVSSFHAEGGRAFEFDAKDISKRLLENSGFRQAFNSVVNKLGNRAFSRWSPAMLGTMDRFKINLRDTLGMRQPDESGTKKTLRQLISEKVKIRGPAGEALEDASRVASSIAARVSLRINTLLTYIAKASKGSGIILSVAIGCMASQVPSMIKKTMVGLQEASMVSASAPTFTAMSAIKAGDGDPETAAEVGNEWTATDKDGFSALEAIGTRYGLHGDTDIASDPTYNNVTPVAFGDTMGALDLADLILNNPATDAVCPLLMNPITGAAMAGGLHAVIKTAQGASGPGGWAAGAIDFAIGGTIAVLLSAFGGDISEGMANAITPGIADLSQEGLNKLDESARTSGNMHTSALGIISKNNGALTFGSALTTDELPEMAKAIQEQEADNAEIARATLSPFDATSKYTFLGSVVNQFLPYYSSFSSAAGVVSVIGSIVPMSFGSIVKSTTASATTNPAVKYDGVCPDPEAVAVVESDKKLATDIFCHPVYGVFPESNWDPVALADKLSTGSNPQIDSKTGEAKEPANGVLDTVVGSLTNFEFGDSDPIDFDISYSDWIGICGDPENASQCTSETSPQDYALYTAAKTVNSMLDMDGNQDIDDEDVDIGLESLYTELFATDSSQSSTDTSNEKGSGDTLNIISSLYGLVHSYTSSMASYSSNTLVDNLSRFALWR